MITFCNDLYLYTCVQALLFIYNVISNQIFNICTNIHLKSLFRVIIHSLLLHMHTHECTYVCMYTYIDNVQYLRGHQDFLCLRVHLVFHQVPVYKQCITVVPSMNYLLTFSPGFPCGPSGPAAPTGPYKTI